MTSDELADLYRPRDSVPSLPALDGLDDVDWSGLQDAYGPATNVPARLRALVSPTSEHQYFACQDLFQTILHQGTVCSATAAIIPFLFNLLEEDGPHDKTMVANLLAWIADGKPPFSRCENDPNEAARLRAILNKARRSLDEEMAEGRRYGAEIRRLIAQRFDVLYPYLRHPEPEVRTSIAVALGHFPEIAKRLLPDLEAVLSEESDSFVRETLQAVVERVRMRSP